MWPSWCVAPLDVGTRNAPLGVRPMRDLDVTPLLVVPNSRKLEPMTCPDVSSRSPLLRSVSRSLLWKPGAITPRLSASRPRMALDVEFSASCPLDRSATRLLDVPAPSRRPPATGPSSAPLDSVMLPNGTVMLPAYVMEATVRVSTLDESLHPPALSPLMLDDTRRLRMLDACRPPPYSTMSPVLLSAATRLQAPTRNSVLDSGPGSTSMGSA